MSKMITVAAEAIDRRVPEAERFGQMSGVAKYHRKSSDIKLLSRFFRRGAPHLTQ